MNLLSDGPRPHYANAKSTQIIRINVMKKRHVAGKLNGMTSPCNREQTGEQAVLKLAFSQFFPSILILSLPPIYGRSRSTHREFIPYLLQRSLTPIARLELALPAWSLLSSFSKTTSLFVLSIKRWRNDEVNVVQGFWCVLNQSTLFLLAHQFTAPNPRTIPYTWDK